MTHAALKNRISRFKSRGGNTLSLLFSIYFTWNTGDFVFQIQWAYVIEKNRRKPRVLCNFARKIRNVFYFIFIKYKYAITCEPYFDVNLQQMFYFCVKRELLNYFSVIFLYIFRVWIWHRNIIHVSMSNINSFILYQTSQFMIASNILWAKSVETMMIITVGV